MLRRRRRREQRAYRAGFADALWIAEKHGLPMARGTLQLVGQYVHPGDQPVRAEGQPAPGDVPVPGEPTDFPRIPLDRSI